MTLAQVRKIAAALPETTEEPHFEKLSFRVRGKIFATAPPDGRHLHVFVAGDDIDAAVAAAPQAFEVLTWGKQVSGLRVTLAKADAALVRHLLEVAWRRKAPKRLAAKGTG